MMNKKVTLILLALFSMSVVNASVDISTIWQISKNGNNLEEAKDFSGVDGLGGNLNRGLAFGKFGDKEYVFITTGSGADQNHINYYDAASGKWAGKLNMEPVNSATLGSIHKIADVEVIDGKIYTVSLSVVGNSVDFCMWDGLDASPVITSFPESTIRVEKLSASGSIAKGTGKIWISGPMDGIGSPNPSRPVYVRSIALGTDGSLASAFVDFGQVPDNNNLYNCTVNPDGSVLVKGANKPMHLIDKNGTYIRDTQNMTPELTLSQTIRYFGTHPHNGRYYYLLNSYSKATGISNGTVTKIYSMLPGNLNSFNCVAELPNFGDLANNNMGDIDFKWEGDDLYIYSMSSNNGFGAFKVTGLFDKPENRSNTQFTLLWENSVEGSNLPGFYSNLEYNQDKTTGLAVGTVGGEKSVYVVKKIYLDPDQPASGEDPWGPSGDHRKNMFVFNADNGEIKGELSIRGIWGKEMQDASITEDGIFMTTFVVNERETMNAFSFPTNAHEGSLSNVTFAYDSECPALLGSNIFAIGSVAEGTAKIYATTESDTENYVYTFGMAGPNKWDGFYAEEEFTIPSAGKGSVSVKPDKSFYWNAKGGKFLYHDGKTISGTESTLEGSVIKFIASKNGFDFVAVLNGNKADVYKLTPGNPDTKELWGSSPILGANPSNIGDIEVGFAEDGAPILYVLSANNGFAAWKLNLDATGIEQTAKNNTFAYLDSSGRIVFSEMVRKVELFTIDGRLVKTLSNVNSINSELKGILILRFIDTEGRSNVQKIVAK